MWVHKVIQIHLNFLFSHCTLCTTDLTFRMPQLIFIRHGEKSGKDVVNLSPKGFARARLLPEYLLHPYMDFSVPTSAYIMCLRGEYHSERCWQTMKPTVDAGGLRHHLVYRSKTESLAHLLPKLQGVIVICWEHSRIVDLLNVLVGENAVSAWGLDPDAIQDDSKCFDATWVCDVDENTLRLRVFRQFDIVNDLPHYEHDRHRVWYDKSFVRPSHHRISGFNRCVIM